MHEETEKIILRGRKVIGGVAEAEALVSPVPLMGWGNVDERRGCTVERNHPLYGISFKDKVLVFPEPRGSGGFLGYGRTRYHDSAPAAFVYRRGMALTVMAAMIANVPTVTDLDQDPIAVIATGDRVRVDGDRGLVEVYRQKKA